MAHVEWTLQCGCFAFQSAALEGLHLKIVMKLERTNIIQAIFSDPSVLVVVSMGRE